jgi:putative toxin-antitoxin system antitoxin component (TIGR02293 family)
MEASTAHRDLDYYSWVGVRAKDVVGVVERVEKGLPLQSLERLAKLLEIKSSSEIASLLLIPPRTFYHRKKARRLTPGESDRLLRAARAAAATLLFFKEFALLCFDEDYAAAQGWPTLGLDILLLALVIAAVAKNGRVASGIGMVVYFPMLFFAGVWTPGDTMPDGARAVADFTPLGAATEAMADSWVHGDWPSALHLLVLVGWSLVGGVAAAKLFRWE